MMRLLNIAAVSCALLMVLTLTHAAPPARAGAREDAALKVARAWLDLADQGKFARCYAQCASMARAMVTRDNYVKTMQAARPPLGRVLSRQVESTTFSRSLPGAPDGEYVVVKFATRFEKKESAVETLPVTKDKDGAWKVAGYFIR